MVINANSACLAGTMLSEVYFPNFPVLLANSEYDFFIIDCEHGPFTYREVSDMIAMARRCGVEAIVRIPEIKRECITKYLDMGADGLLIPMVRDADDARRIVDFAKYSPIGNRGISISRAHSNYAPGDMNAYMQQANAHTKLLVQIELCSALEQVEEIAAVEGVSALMVGPSDLGMALDVFPSLDAPVLLDAVERVAKAAAARNLGSGIITGNADLIAHARRAGMNLICCGSELRVLGHGLKENRKVIMG